MAILFYQQKRKQIYLGLLAILLVALLIFIWFKFLRGTKEGLSLIAPVSIEYRERKIQVDFAKLENELLKDLQPFTAISSPGFELGRDNPFTPHTGTTTEITAPFRLVPISP